MSALVTQRQFYSERILASISRWSTEILSLSVSDDRWSSAESLSILELYLKELLINYFTHCYAISVRVCLVLAKFV